MDSPPIDPRWPKLLSLSVHEFRTPMTVVAGYIRMLLKDRAGPLSDQQRRLLEEAEKSCARLSALLTEVSDLSALEGGRTTFNRQPLDVRETLRGAVADLPPLPDREIAIDLTTDNGPAPLQGDATRLRLALTSVLMALRRELVTSERLFVRERARDAQGQGTYDITIGDDETLQAIASAGDELPVFDEWRGGCGLSLPVARRIIEAHGGRIWGPPGDRKAGARLSFPRS